MRAGRLFTQEDNSLSQLVAILNEAAVEKFFPGESPIGKRLKAVAAKDWYQVVGVASDARDFGLNQPTSPVIYLPITQLPLSQDWVNIAVRTTGDPTTVVPSLRREIAAINDESTLSDIATMDARLADSIASPRLNALVLAVFGGLALTLAAVGVFGVIAYSVSRRTNEIGIRLALGAQRLAVLRMIMAQVFKMVLIGTLIGLACAFGLTRFLSSLLFGVKPTDTITFTVVIVVVVLAAVAASYIPARRATKVDPMTALRHE
jgi:putative ABC transport system permease protein